MIALRLFSAADPSRQVDVRHLAERDTLTIGRDAAADWPLPDPERALSRLHLTVGVNDGAVMVTDTSTNGVTLASSERRLARDMPMRIDLGERLELGRYVILVERAEGEAPVRAGPSRAAANPFLQAGDEPSPAPARAVVDPFASALPADPLALGDLFKGQGAGDLRDGGDPLVRGDAWGRRRELRAGDWDAPSGAPPATDAMIGSAPAWRELEGAPKEGGFGFDAPFTRPVLQAPTVDADDLAIPSDWDAPPASPTPAPAIAPSTAATSAPILSPAPSPALAPPATAARPPGPSADRTLARAPEPIADPEPTPILAVASPRDRARPPPTPAPAPRVAPPPSELMQAFCAGARLDPAGFAGEDPAAVMQRLGAVYRHMVLGLGDVMSARTALKTEYRMVRTTVSAADNNPFKWSPPQRVAGELLRAPEDGFLDGPDAVAESFTDVKRHLLCMLAGLRAALASTLDALAPSRIEEAVKDQPFALKTRAAVLWTEYARTHGQLRHEAQDSADSPVNREFRAAYEKQLAELDRMQGR